MARMRLIKNQIRAMLENADYAENIDVISAMGMSAVAPLIACLPLPDPMCSRAARMLGIVVAGIAEQRPEDARTVLRRLMWHMNEDSGNLGWGVPEAFAEILVRSRVMAAEFNRILLSYIQDTGKADNYCDYSLLRRSCYRAVGILAQSRPDLVDKAVPVLIGGLADQDGPCRGYAAHALGMLQPGEEAIVPLQDLEKNGQDIICDIFDGEDMREERAADLATKALSLLLAQNP